MDHQQVPLVEHYQVLRHWYTGYMGSLYQSSQGQPAEKLVSLRQEHVTEFAPILVKQKAERKGRRMEEGIAFNYLILVTSPLS